MARQDIEQAIDHRFARRDLLSQALTHRSHGIPNNERLEFLGDSVLNFVVADLLYQRFTDLREGELSRLRASLVNQDALAGIAGRIALGDALNLGDGEVKSGGRQRPSMLADALEAMFGAVYLDAGFDVVSRVIEKLYQPLLAQLDPLASGKDPKTELQELMQGKRLGLPRYELSETRGEAHAQQFSVVCHVAELGIQGDGTGSSRRAAEQAAAQAVLAQVRGA